MLEYAQSELIGEGEVTSVDWKKLYEETYKENQDLRLKNHNLNQIIKKRRKPGFLTRIFYSVV